jgi:hypothetical protein
MTLDILGRASMEWSNIHRLPPPKYGRSPEISYHVHDNEPADMETTDNIDSS